MTSHPMRRSLLIAGHSLVVLATACGQTTNAPQAPTVTIEQPTRQPVVDYLDVTGAVESAEQVEIRARVEGFLQSIHFEEGQNVEKGQLLYVIDPREYEAQVESARAALETARAALALAHATLLRREKAFKTGAVSELEVLENRATRDVSAAKLQSAEADLRRAELDLSYTRITAPVAGKAGKTEVDPGNLVGASENTLLTSLVVYDPIHAYFSISERQILRIMDAPAARAEGPTSEGMDEGRRKTWDVEIGRTTDQDFPFAGVLDFSDQSVDEETGTFLVRGVFDNPDPVQLIPGLFVRGRIPLQQREDALFISERALGSDQSGRYLLTVDADNVAEYRSVKIGALVDGMRVIEEGITADDRVITKGVLYARPGEPVSPATDVAAAPPDPASSD